MNNEEALDILSEFVELASTAVKAGTWAQAYLTEGGEPTWDAVKHVSRLASALSLRCEIVQNFEDIYEDIIP